MAIAIYDILTPLIKIMKYYQIVKEFPNLMTAMKVSKEFMEKSVCQTEIFGRAFNDENTNKVKFCSTLNGIEMNKIPSMPECKHLCPVVDEFFRNDVISRGLTQTETSKVIASLKRLTSGKYMEFLFFDLWEMYESKS